MAESVLIVDNDLQMLDQYGSGLVSGGYKVEIAYEVKLAVDLLMKQKIDAMVINLDMQDDDGYALIKQTRKILKYRKLPLILLTDKITREVKEKIEKIELTELLVKPLSVPELQSTVERFLSNNNGKSLDRGKISEREVLKNLSLIVVDDEETIRILLQEFLEMHVKYVGVAESVDEAKKLCEDHDFDIVLSDIQMPEKSGFEFIEWINEFPKMAGLPVVMMTGVKLDLSSVKRAKQLQIDKYLAKPFDLEQLRSILYKMGMAKYRFNKLKNFKDYIAEMETSDAKEEQFLMSSSLKQILEQKKILNILVRKIQRFAQDDYSIELSELNVEKSRMEIKVNQMQDELAETKKMFFERRKLFATIKRFNVQRREKMKN